MALALADRYSSLSFQDCLRSCNKNGSEGSQCMGDPLVDIPLSDNHQRTFVVPPGIEVSTPNRAHYMNINIICFPGSL